MNACQTDSSNVSCKKSNAWKLLETKINSRQNLSLNTISNFSEINSRARNPEPRSEVWWWNLRWSFGEKCFWRFSPAKEARKSPAKLRRKFATNFAENFINFTLEIAGAYQLLKNSRSAGILALTASLPVTTQVWDFWVLCEELLWQDLRGSLVLPCEYFSLLFPWKEAIWYIIQVVLEGVPPTGLQL